MTEQIVDLIEGVMPGPRGLPGPKGDQGLPGMGAVPADEAVAGYVSTSGASRTKTALQRMLKPLVVVVAASDSSEEEQAAASVVCSGAHDEVTLQRVIDAMMPRGGVVRLCRGTYVVDGFSGGVNKAALRLDAGAQCTLRIEGPYYPQRGRGTGYDWDPRCGAVLKVTQAALDQLGDDRGFVLTGYGPDADPDVWDHSQYPGMGLELDGIGICLTDNAHDITCVDTSMFTRNLIARVNVGVSLSDAALAAGIDAARSIGYRSVMQKQMSQSFDDCAAYGMRVGFDMGGEHLVCTHCIAIRCYTGWRFYATDNTRGGHPLTCIECSDEICRTGPVFAGAREFEDTRIALPGVSLIAYNREVVNDPESPWYCLQQATEAVLDCMRGYVSYQISDSDWDYRSTNKIPFWEPGHGRQCDTLNLTGRRIGPISYEGLDPSIDRMSLIRGRGASLGEQVFCTNATLKRNEFRSDMGIGVPVYWDGRSWRTYDNDFAAKGPNLFDCTPGALDNFRWEAVDVGVDHGIDLVIPSGSHSYKALTVADATIPSAGDYELHVPEATGLMYAEIVFGDKTDAAYTIRTGRKISIHISAATTLHLRLNYSGTAPVPHRETITPSLRRIWLHENQ